MNKVWSRVVGVVLAMAAVVPAMATVTSEAAADNACKPGVKITNGTSDTIKVTKLDYRVVGTSTWYSEDLANRNIGENDSSTWGSEKLAKSSIGDRLEFKVRYEVGSYNKETTAVIATSGQCDNSRLYTLRVTK